MVALGSNAIDGYYARLPCDIVGSLPNLKIVEVCCYRQSKLDFQFSSKSLQAIDFSDAGKRQWITQCECPNLRRYLCVGNFYGNGVRPRKDDGSMNYDYGKMGDGDCAGTIDWFEGTFIDSKI